MLIFHIKQKNEKRTPNKRARFHNHLNLAYPLAVPGNVGAIISLWVWSRKFRPFSHSYLPTLVLPCSGAALGNVEVIIFLSMNCALVSMPFFVPSIRSYWAPM